MMVTQGSAGVGRRESGSHAARKDGAALPSSPTPPLPADDDDRVLPDPAEPGITVDERVARIGMSLNHWLHPDYTDRELRMLDDIASLVGFARDVLPILKRAGVSYPLMSKFLDRIAAEHGPWNAS